jgi:hypothetical protein
MSTVYNPESDTIAQIEKLELAARDIRQRMEKAHSDEDKRVLNEQLDDIKDQITFLRAKLP